MKQFIHIPKTGGTSVKFMTLDNPDWDYARHGRKLHDENIDNIVFTIRDPLERFLSGCKHIGASMPKYSETTVRAEDFVEKGKNNKLMSLVFKPMSEWLGTLEEFKTYEHLIHAVVETGALGAYFTAQGIEPQHYLDGDSYNIEFDSTLSEASLAWLKEAYAEDYALYEYIKTRPYYVSGEQ